MGGDLTKIDNPMHDPENWMDLYGDLLYRCALLRVRDFTAAEDIVQETLLAALGAYKNFKGHSTLQTWLIAILKNKSADHIRKKIKEQVSDEMEYLTNAVEGNIYRRGEQKLRYCKCFDSPMKLYAYKELMNTLYKCLSELPDRMAKVFIMREIDGFSTKEICEALNITSTNCWVMLHRARRRLRVCIGACWLDFQK